LDPLQTTSVAGEGKGFCDMQNGRLNIGLARFRRAKTPGTSNQGTAGEVVRAINGLNLKGMITMEVEVEPKTVAGPKAEGDFKGFSKYHSKERAGDDHLRCRQFPNIGTGRLLHFSEAIPGIL
jgi:hypothetical protein